MDRFLSRALILSLALTALGCDDLDLDEEKPTEGPASAPREPTGGATTPEAARALIVDATERDPAVWTYVDLESGAQSRDPAAVAGWDIALQRSNIRLKEGARVSVLVDRTFESVTEAPTDGWSTDSLGGARPTYLLSSGDTAWFDYDGATHVLTPRRHVNVVQTDAGFQKLVVLAWTNEAGTPAVYRLQVGPVAAPRGAIRERDAEVDVNTSASRSDEAGTDAATDAGT